MTGAIAGDIVGSVYEARKRWTHERNPDFQPLFAPEATFTDDSVLTIAQAEAICEGHDFTEQLIDYYHRFPSVGYGKQFRTWAESGSKEPYNSWGNGAAMRVSPVAYAFDSLDEVLINARESAEVTHNHPDGIAGAKAVAGAVFLARTGADYEDIAEFVEHTMQCDLSRSIDEIRPGYRFDSSARGSVPEAVTAFLESDSFEHAIRLAVSLGGDADTLASIAGAIAEPFYGAVPEQIASEARSRLTPPLLASLEKFEEQFSC